MDIIFYIQWPEVLLNNLYLLAPILTVFACCVHMFEDSQGRQYHSRNITSTGSVPDWIGNVFIFYIYCLKGTEQIKEVSAR